MYYHCLAHIIGLGYHAWVNRTKEDMITEIIGPYLRGQVVQVHWTATKPTGNALFNFGSTNYLRIFRTDKRLNDSQREQFDKNRAIGAECTVELIKEIRFDKATMQAKSLMEKLILPPKHQIFVIMKFDDEYLDSAYKGVIRPLGEEFGYQVLRIDDIENSGMITAQIIESIAESEIVLADLTGARPNCYYETGVAYATGRELILTAREEEEVHFDLSVHRFIRWKTEHDLRTQLRQRIEAIQTRT